MHYPRIYNAVTELLDRNVSNGLGNKAAFIDQAGQVSYRQLRINSNRVANLLAAHHIERESRVAILMHDTTDWPAVFLGAIRAGIVPVAMNTLLGSDSYRYILEDSRAQALFVSEALLAAITPALDTLPLLREVFVVGENAGEHVNFHQQLANQPDQFDTVETCCDEVAFWLYSSGSTGTPKGVPHVHSSMMETARNFGQGVLGIQEEDVVFSAAKLFFAYGLGNALSFPMSVGATTILWSARPTPADMFATMAAHRAEYFLCRSDIICSDAGVCGIFSKPRIQQQ